MTTRWESDAACRDTTDLNYWFDEPHNARQICLKECPVRRECLQSAMAAEASVSVKFRHGVWGGLGPAQRQALHRKRVAAARELAAAPGDPPGQVVAA